MVLKDTPAGPVGTVYDLDLWIYTLWMYIRSSAGGKHDFDSMV